MDSHNMADTIVFVHIHTNNERVYTIMPVKKYIRKDGKQRSGRCSDTCINVKVRLRADPFKRVLPPLLPLLRNLEGTALFKSKKFMILIKSLTTNLK